MECAHNQVVISQNSLQRAQKRPRDPPQDRTIGPDPTFTQGMYTEAKTLIPHGIDAQELRLLLRRVQQQGMPYTNRATRRRASQAARQAQAKKAAQHPHVESYPVS
jgi:hypothetical protein